MPAPAVAELTTYCGEDWCVHPVRKGAPLGIKASVHAHRSSTKRTEYALIRSLATRVGRAVVVSVWSERPPEAATDEVSSVLSSEPDVEYTEVVHPQPVDPARVPLRKGTDTVYSELNNSPHGAADPRDYGSVEYAELNGEQPEINHYSPEVKDYQDLPVPVD
ncbi:hypothetical protein Q8A73_003836 [Channa argus]|nr:hypothetical protein Q8A73_003836 [Channa argus]